MCKSTVSLKLLKQGKNGKACLLFSNLLLIAKPKKINKNFCKACANLF